MKRLALLLTLFSTLALYADAPPAAEKAPWEFLSTTTIGAKAFLEAHPEWDGRGVLIAVCDSGVDLGLPGLLTTSDGKPKIVDARDFTDQNRVAFETALEDSDEHGKALHGKDGKWLYGFEKLNLSPASGEKLQLVYFKEEGQKGSDVLDLNHNGRSDDVYGMVVFLNSEKKWVAVLDTNGDGDLSDEKASGDFAETRQALTLRGRDLHAQAEVIQVAINLWPKEKEAALYFADNSHGTHVAGICAGHTIDGKPGYDGIAPGAQILALKLGSGVYSGGATTPGSMVNAWKYAVEKAEELGMPLVIQMSYGVGSEDEGAGEAETLLDDLLRDHPSVTATISAGNNGPGLSTVGMPACMKEALSVGAVLAKTSARDLYGASLSQDEMFSFSSRGGEMAKPDVVCPGFAASTVPRWAGGGNVMRGTSMAAPQAAGGVAVLLSAVKASGLPVRRDWMNAAIRRGAVPLPGYGPVEQGPGMFQVGRSWSIYQSLANGNASRPTQWKIETESPEMKGAKGPAIFWKGDFYPKEGRTQEVVVTPLFPETASADYKATHQESFDLVCDADWLRIQQGSIYSKAGAAAKFAVAFAPQRLSAPGLYSTEVRAFDKSLSASERQRLGPEWRLPVTVVIPHPLTPGAPLTKTLSPSPAKVQRIFLRPAPTTQTLTLKVELGGARGGATVYLYDPEGREAERTTLRPDRKEASFDLSSSQIDPGTWELAVYGSYMNTAPVEVKATVAALEAPGVVPGHPLTLSQPQGKPATADLTLTPSGPTTFEGRGSGEITSTLTQKEVKASSALWTKKFSLAQGETAVRFEIELSATHWAKFTDLAVVILDGDEVLLSDGLGYRKGSLDFGAAQGAKQGKSYTLKLFGGTADPEDDSPNWAFTLREIHTLATPVPLKVEQGKSAALVLYPDHPTTLTLTAQAPLPAAPDGGSWLGRLRLSERESETGKLVLDLRFKPKSGE